MTGWPGKTEKWACRITVNLSNASGVKLGDLLNISNILCQYYHKKKRKNLLWNKITLSWNQETFASMQFLISKRCALRSNKFVTRKYFSFRHFYGAVFWRTKNLQKTKALLSHFSSTFSWAETHLQTDAAEAATANRARDKINNLNPWWKKLGR